MTRALFVAFSSLFPQPEIELGLVFREHAIDVLFHHLYVQGILAKHGCSPWKLATFSRVEVDHSYSCKLVFSSYKLVYNSI